MIQPGAALVCITQGDPLINSSHLSFTQLYQLLLKCCRQALTETKNVFCDLNDGLMDRGDQRLNKGSIAAPTVRTCSENECIKLCMHSKHTCIF